MNLLRGSLEGRTFLAVRAIQKDGGTEFQDVGDFGVGFAHRENYRPLSHPSGFKAV